jgi:ABC-type nickel/cobalt efflux system permease component RcnA
MMGALRSAWLPVALLGAAAAAIALAGGWSFLSLGFVIGMAHALEADHLAAVGTMLNRKEGSRSMMLKGAVWGLGHTLSLFTICSVVLVLGLTLSERMEASLEGVVGVMIVGLGLRGLWRLYRDRVHLHVHEHGGHRHLHAHSHAGDERPHALSRHDHAHPARRHIGTLGVGLVHGAAGSGGLLVLTVAATQDLIQALGYFAVFGIGSLAGMATLTTIASFPLGMIDRGATWMRTATSLAIGLLALWVGGSLAAESFASLM